MYREISKLLLFGELGENSILENVAQIIKESENPTSDKDELIKRSYHEVKRILDLSTDCGFDTNLWQSYLTYILMTNENSFTKTCERVGSTDGSVNLFALGDFEVFRKLMHYDFSELEKRLGIDCFSVICNYRAIPKRKRLYNHDISTQVAELRAKLADAASAQEIFDIVTDYYKRYGYGLFAMSRAFRISDDNSKGLKFLPISNVDNVMLDDLLGYEQQKKELRDNTIAFLKGKKANNVLLYGDAGTGKSTSVKALINEYFDSGLRMIEIYKHQFCDLSAVISAVKNRNYRFIIFIDDLSFEENEVEYKFLKAVIEGGVETRPENILIYATSNRRHLVKETWKDRDDMEHKGDIHRSDTIEEKTSLAARFGVSINYNAPTPKEYHEIVRALAEKNGITMDDEELRRIANTWEICHGGFSGRAAQQLIQYLESREE
ncbi:MAG: ATP-binding protein [Eubacteriales bacterium]|nr:ATP-binding protein [Eubacteriales bacterium]